MAKKYLLDTNAYFAILKYISAGCMDDENINEVINGECFISKATQIEIVSVIGKYARGSSGGLQVCERIHADGNIKCGAKYITPKQKKWSQAKLKDWLRLEKEISSGINPLFSVTVLDINDQVITSAEMFIQNALLYNFKSMDSIIVGTAMANSIEGEQMIVVTADKAMKAGMDKVKYPHISVS